MLHYINTGTYETTPVAWVSAVQWKRADLWHVLAGINPVAQIFTSAVSAGRSSAAVAKAQAAVTANAKAVASQMRSINANAAVAS